MSSLARMSMVATSLVAVCLTSCDSSPPRLQTYRPQGEATYSIVSYPEFTRSDDLDLSITIINQSEQDIRAQFWACSFGTVEFRDEGGELVLTRRQVAYSCTTDSIAPSVLVPGASRNFPSMPIDISPLPRGNYNVSLIYATSNPTHLFPAEDFVFNRR